jgi:hypothetical protein
MAETASPQREPLYAGQFEIPIAARSTAEGRKPRNIRELKKEKKAIMLAAEFNHEAFSAVQDEIDYPAHDGLRRASSASQLISP